MSQSPKIARALSLWLPVAAWAALLFALSSQTDLPAPPIGDKIVHAAAYAVLGATLVRALAGARWQGVTPTVAIAAVVLTTLYGVSDEFHQSFVPGRSVEVADVAADLTGGTVAAVLAFAGRRWLDRRRAAGTPGGPAGRI